MPSGIWLYSYIAMWLLLMLESLLLVMLIRQVGNLNAFYLMNDADAGLPLGAAAPLVSTEDAFGRGAALATCRGNKTLVFFLSTSCPGCRKAMAWLPAISELAGLELLLVFPSSQQRVILFLAEVWPVTPMPRFAVVADNKGSISEKYKAVTVPYLVVVDEDGLIGGKGSAVTAKEIMMLCQQTDRLRDQRLGKAETEEVALTSPAHFPEQGVIRGQ